MTREQIENRVIELDHDIAYYKKAIADNEGFLASLELKFNQLAAELRFWEEFLEASND